MPGDASDRTRMRSQPANGRPSTTPRRYPRAGAPVAGAPGWYVVRRKSRIPAHLDRLLRQRPGFGVLTIGAAAGAVALVLVLSLVRADWDEEPAEPSTAISVPPVASSPGAAPREPPAASSEAPAAGPTPEADAAIKAAGDSQGASATAASRTKADPAPPDATPASLLESRQAFEWQSPPRPLASATSSNSPGGAGPSREQVPGPGSLQSSPALPQSPPASSQAAAGPATPGSTAKPQAVGDVSSLEDRPAVAAGEIRVFIHHAANSHGDAALAQQVADHLRRQASLWRTSGRSISSSASRASGTSSTTTGAPASVWSTSSAGSSRKRDHGHRIRRATSPISSRNRAQATWKSGYPPREATDHLRMSGASSGPPLRAGRRKLKG